MLPEETGRKIGLQSSVEEVPLADHVGAAENREGGRAHGCGPHVNPCVGRRH